MQCTYLLVYRHSDRDGWLLCGCDSSFSMENVYIHCDYIHCRKVLFFVVVFLYGFTWDDPVNEG